MYNDTDSVVRRKYKHKEMFQRTSMFSSFFLYFQNLLKGIGIFIPIQSFWLIDAGCVEGMLQLELKC